VIPAEELASLEELVQEALARGTASHLKVLGQGEITMVLGWPPHEPRFAAKRLPPFRSASQLRAYADVLERYLCALAAAGVETVPTHLCHVARRDGTLAAYCVQQALPARSLVATRLTATTPGPGHPLVHGIVEAAARTVSARVGLDAQVSNWAWDGERLRYLDVTTPILSRPDGSSELDPALFLGAFPWAVRGLVRRFALPSMLRRYHRLRSVLRDVCANLIKERLEDWLPAFLEAANAHLERPLTASEVRGDYRSDARRWSLLLRLRRADRWWQRTVRRRPYPFLLPEGVVR
jgi:hypothetical protein